VNELPGVRHETIKPLSSGEALLRMHRFYGMDIQVVGAGVIHVLLQSRLDGSGDLRGYGLR